MYIKSIIFFLLFFSSFGFGQSENPSPKEKLMMQKLNEAHQLTLAQKTEEAITILQELAEKEEEGRYLYVIHGMLGDIYSSKLDIEQANKHYDHLLAMKPNDGYIYFKKGQMLKHFSGKIKDAIECFETSKKYGFQNVEMYLSLGFCYKVAAEQSSTKADIQKFYFTAIENYKQVLQHKPGNRVALGNLADICFNIGDYDLAYKIYSALHQKFPNDIETNIRLGHIYFVTKKYSKAQKMLEKANKLFDSLDIDIKSNQQLFNKKLETNVYYAQTLIALKKINAAKKILNDTIKLGNEVKLSNSVMKFYLQQAKKLLDTIK